MKKLILLLCVTLSQLSSQSIEMDNATDRTGSFYFYWGWNRGYYSNSDIHFKGKDYEFTLKDVKAFDRQSPFSFGKYLNPSGITIPQYNFRFGYFINHHYNISFGIDHMKYVVRQNQTVKINGEIANSNTSYDGTYSDDDIKLARDFLVLEHTDGLNYVNLEFRRFDQLFSSRYVNIGMTEGAGLGILYPRTDSTLLSKKQNDEFHIAGYGLSAVLGFQFEFFNIFFIQSEYKGGYINLPDIQTTQSRDDYADQDFFFSQINLVFGTTF